MGKQQILLIYQMIRLQQVKLHFPHLIYSIDAVYRNYRCALQLNPNVKDQSFYIVLCALHAYPTTYYLHCMYIP